MLAQLDRKGIAAIWECGGCSTPIRISTDRLALLKQGELWTVGIDGASPKKESSAPEVESLIGLTTTSPARILVLARVRGAQQSVRLQPKLVDISNGKLLAAPSEIDQVLNEADAFASFPRPDEYRNSSRLRTSAARPWHVQVQRLDSSNALNEPLFSGWSLQNSFSEVTQRFNAIWIDDNRVAFLELP
jgi:hypothetical protein